MKISTCIYKKQYFYIYFSWFTAPSNVQRSEFETRLNGANRKNRFAKFTVRFRCVAGQESIGGGECNGEDTWCQGFNSGSMERIQVDIERYNGIVVTKTIPIALNVFEGIGFAATGAVFDFVAGNAMVEKSFFGSMAQGRRRYLYCRSFL